MQFVGIKSDMKGLQPTGIDTVGRVNTKAPEMVVDGR